MQLIVSLSSIFILFMLILLFSEIKKEEERKGYNNGYCPRCNAKLKYFDKTFLQERCYLCEKCGYITWVSYDIDK